MKFLALVKKEFRECLPWMCLAFLVFTGFGVASLESKTLVDEMRRNTIWRGDGIVTWCPTPVNDLGPVLLLTALGLAVVMGNRQFYVPAFDRTWAFTLHRPIRRRTIVHAKFTAAFLGLALSLGLPWTVMYLYAVTPGRFMDLVPPRIFWEGWYMIGMGFILYLGTAVSSLYQARWYATKGCGLAFAAGLILMMASPAPFPMPWVLPGIGLIVLGSQVYALTQSKEL